MPKRLRLLIILAATASAGRAGAEEKEWSFAFGQGVGEYAVGSFAEGSSHLALSCAEAGLNPGSASVSLARAGFTPRGPTPATFTTDKGTVTLTLGADGTADFPSAAAPQFAALWRLLANGRALRVSFGPGAPMPLPLTGAATLLGPTVCPKQLAQ